MRQVINFKDENNRDVEVVVMQNVCFIDTEFGCVVVDWNPRNKPNDLLIVVPDMKYVEEEGDDE